MSYRPHCALVTGGAGFIGANFVRHLLATDPDLRLINLDLLTYAGSLENLRDLADTKRHQFIHGDIADAALVRGLMREHRVDTIVHFAAESHVDRSIKDPAAFVNTNVVGTFTLLAAARAFWLEEQRWAQTQCRFHHVSTDEVYGSLGPNDPPFTELTPYAPSSPYAATKAGSDQLVRAYHRTYGLPVIITNCSNNYGPYQFPEKLIPLMIINAIQGKPLPIYGDGMHSRDWLYVVDHCRAIDLVLRQGRTGETYNVSGGCEQTNLAVVRTLCEVLDELRPAPRGGHAMLIRFVTDRPGHDRRYAMDGTKLSSTLGFQPLESFTSGIRKTARWYLDHEEWWRTLMNAQYQDWLAQQYGENPGSAS